MSVGGISLPYGTHLAGFFSSDQGRVRLAVSFLAGGIVEGAVCYLVAEPSVQRDVLAQLGKDQAALHSDVLCGRLVLSEYAALGPAQIEYREAQFVAATARGALSLRVVGDLSGVADGITREELLEYERAYEEILSRRFPVVTLCLYDVRKFSSLDALRALRGHGDGFRYPVERLLD